MRAYVLPTLALAQRCAAIVDAAEGYPRAGRDVGGGVHVRPPFVTQTYALPLKHPTLAEWAYLSDAVTDAQLTAHAAALGLPAAVTLDATWFPAPAVLP